MGVMHSHLGEVCVSRTSEGVWKDEVWGDPCSGYHPFGFPNSSGEARDGQSGVTDRGIGGCRRENLGQQEDLKPGRHGEL